MDHVRLEKENNIFFKLKKFEHPIPDLDQLKNSIPREQRLKFS